ncbi:PHP domain-like protein [Hesseltinella vesiculosa]|uniref:PHP domain-like protein n=1 Tax=Hesseltinella vesiculosa TaxID=101127 RepID=A0A1X2GWU6_9FUNG|nr:PHP domain-like protein [Hesseltinella vesiculosa]
MLFDFNLPYHQDQDQQEQKRLEGVLERIYSIDPRATVAWNLLVKDIRATKVIAPVAADRFGKTITQLTRVTVQVVDSKGNYQLLSANPLNQQIDLLAAQPTNIEVCRHACLAYEVDIISLDLSQPNAALPGYSSAQVAIQRGIFFEICYTQAISERQQRVAFFANVTRLVDQTRGHNLILSSGALRALHIKRPADLCMLGKLFGMSDDQARAAARYNYERVLKKAETRKSTLVAAIQIESMPPESDLKRKQPASPAPESKSQKKKKKKLAASSS